MKVLGPWEGKLTPLTAKEHKPVLIGEKTASMQVDHRVGFILSVMVIDFRFSAPTSMKGTVKPQTTEWIDDRSGPPFVEFTFHYRSQGENQFIVISENRQTERNGSET